MYSLVCCSKRVSMWTFFLFSSRKKEKWFITVHHFRWDIATVSWSWNSVNNFIPKIQDVIFCFGCDLVAVSWRGESWNSESIHFGWDLAAVSWRSGSWNSENDALYSLWVGPCGCLLKNWNSENDTLYLLWLGLCSCLLKKWKLEFWKWCTVFTLSGTLWLSRNAYCKHMVSTVVQ